MIQKLLFRYGLYRAKKAGLQIHPSAQLEGLPSFGSEPFLISIGAKTTVAGKVTFLNHDGATRLFRDQERYRGVIKYGRIDIFENCFIGFGSILMPGVQIGPNSVVAAGSVVTKDVPPNTVVGGIPAKAICSLEEYAESTLEKQVAYDKAAYAKDKKAELLRIFPAPKQ